MEENFVIFPSLGGIFHFGRFPGPVKEWQGFSILYVSEVCVLQTTPERLHSRHKAIPQGHLSGRSFSHCMA